MIPKWSMILIITLMIMGSHAANATTIIPVDLETIVKQSNTVVHVKVISQRSYWENKRIYTDYKVKVLDVMKNRDLAEQDVLTVKVLGGKVGDIALEIDMAPDVKVGQESVMFLVGTPDGTNTIFGLSYGFLPISTHLQNGKEAKVLSGQMFHARKVYDSQRKMKTNDLTGELQYLPNFINRVYQLAGGE